MNKNIPIDFYEIVCLKKILVFFDIATFSFFRKISCDELSQKLYSEVVTGGVL